MDTVTEEKVIQSLKNLSNSLTVILVSHRISVLRNCDQIILVEDKKIADEGNYEYLEKNNMIFKGLIERQRNNLINVLPK